MPLRPRSSPLQLVRLVGHLPRLAKVFWRLFRDRRVPLRAKAIVLAGVGYLLLPTDLLPDILPFVGVLDDISVLLLAGRAFLSLCPQEVVHEHVMAVSREAEAGNGAA